MIIMNIACFLEHCKRFTLKMNNSVCIHHRNIQLVAILMFKVKNGLCPEIMKDLFQFNTNPNNINTFVIPRVRGEYMGKLSLRYFGPVVWETMLLGRYKAINLLEKFKTDINPILVGGGGKTTPPTGKLGKAKNWSSTILMFLKFSFTRFLKVSGHRHA